MVCLCHFHSRNELLSNSLGFPGGSDGKESACKCRRPRFDGWVGKILWKRKWQPTALFCLENSINRGVWQPTVCGGHKETRLTDQHFGNNSKAFTEASSGGSENFWFIFSVNIGENLFGICRLLHVSALCVSGDVCIFEVKHTIPDRTWMWICFVCSWKKVHQKLSLAQILSEWPGGRNNIFWYQRLFGD